MKKEDFKVGNVVCLLRVDTRYEQLPPDKRILEAEVIGIGRKYLKTKVRNLPHVVEFDMSNHFVENTTYSPDFMLFLSKEEAMDYIRKKKSIQNIHRLVESYNLLERMPQQDILLIESLLNKAKGGDKHE